MKATRGLTGCAGVGWSAKAGCNGGGCSVEGEIHGGTQQKLMAGGNGESSMLSTRTGITSADLASVDANSAVIDTSGCTVMITNFGNITLKQIGRPSCTERVSQYVLILVVDVSLTNIAYTRLDSHISTSIIP